jgi:hypothetical protein
MVYQKDLSFAQIQVLVHILKLPLSHVPERTGEFRTGGTCSYDDEIQCSFGDDRVESRLPYRGTCRNFMRIGRSTVSTGKPGHTTPTGVLY